MVNKTNPFTGDTIPSNDGEFYSKAEVDALVAGLQNQINTKAAATAISGTFVSADPEKTITVTNGVITNIV